MIVVDGTAYVTHAEAARRLGIAPKTLSNRQWSGRLALPARIIGNAPFYLLSDVEQQHLAPCR